MTNFLDRIAKRDLTVVGRRPRLRRPAPRDRLRRGRASAPSASTSTSSGSPPSTPGRATSRTSTATGGGDAWKPDASSASDRRADLARADAIFIAVPTPFDDAKTPDLHVRAQGHRDGARRAAPRHARHPPVDDVPRHHHRGGAADPRAVGPAWPATTSTSPSRRSGSTPATRTGTSATRPRSSAASTTTSCPPGRRAARVGHGAHRAGPGAVHAGGGRAGQAAREHLPGGEHRARSTSWRSSATRWASTSGRSSTGAATKPFGFQAFYPGIGPGGHCIPVDPYYLSWRARVFDFQTKFIELAADTNLRMADYVRRRVGGAAQPQRPAPARRPGAVLGAASSPNVSDMRNSRAVRVIELLTEAGR